MSLRNIYSVFCEETEEDIQNIDTVNTTDVNDKKVADGGEADKIPAVGDSGDDIEELDNTQQAAVTKTVAEITKEMETSTEAVCEAMDEIRDFERQLETVGAYQSAGAYSTEQADVATGRLLDVAMPFSLEEWDISQEGVKTNAIFAKLGNYLSESNKKTIFVARLHDCVSATYDIYGEVKELLASVYKTDFVKTFNVSASLYSVKSDKGALDSYLGASQDYEKAVVGIILKAISEIGSANGSKAAEAIAQKALDACGTKLKSMKLFSQIDLSNKKWFGAKPINKALAASTNPGGAAKYLKSGMPVTKFAPSPASWEILGKGAASKMLARTNRGSETILKGSTAIDAAIKSLKGNSDAKSIKVASTLASRMIYSTNHVKFNTAWLCNDVLDQYRFALSAIVRYNNTHKDQYVSQKIMSKISSAITKTVLGKVTGPNAAKNGGAE